LGIARRKIRRRVSIGGADGRRGSWCFGAALTKAGAARRVASAAVRGVDERGKQFAHHVGVSSGEIRSPGGCGQSISWAAVTLIPLLE
jgi:hypothetical protein